MVTFQRAESSAAVRKCGAMCVEETGCLLMSQSITRIRSSDDCGKCARIGTIYSKHPECPTCTESNQAQSFFVLRLGFTMNLRIPICVISRDRSESVICFGALIPRSIWISWISLRISSLEMRALLKCRELSRCAAK